MKTSPPKQIFSPGVWGDKSSLLEKTEVVHFSERGKKLSTLRKIIIFSIILIIFFFLGKTLYYNLREISAHRWSLKPLYLVLSFLCVVINLAMASYVWKKILSFFQITLPFEQSFKIMSASGMGKYIPGKVWQYLSQIYLGQKVGLPKGITFFSMVLLFVAYNLVGILLFLFSLFFWQRFSPFLISSLLLIFISTSLFIFYPPVLNKVLKILLHLFKRESVPIKARFDQIIGILLILIMDWVIFGIGVYLLVNSFYSISFDQTVILCGIFAISVISGILSFFVPAGLGIREGVQSYLLSFFIPISMAILISLVMRVWMTLGELVCFLIASKVKKPELT
jgi:uncharacterized membrane protein YbhN (UPF0104 family)